MAKTVRFPCGRRSGLLSFLVLALLALVGHAEGPTAESGVPSAEPVEVEREVVELIPDKKASWGASRLFAPISGLFLGGPGYWYDPRKLEIDTTPSEAYVDIFYVRGNFQRGYEQAESPVTVLLPSRIEADERDSVTIRVMADGYVQKDIHVKVRSRTEKVVVDLEPLPNTLEALSEFYLAGRGRLTFLTDEALTFRIQKADAGFSLVLTETAGGAAAEEAARSVGSPIIASLESRQLGEDLVLEVSLTEKGRQHEVRSRQSYDAVRRLHSFVLDLVPADGGAADIERVRGVLPKIRARDVGGCALAFEEVLRASLGDEELARAMVPKDRFMDRYSRATMRRLGQLSPGGRVEFLDGSRFEVAIPIELSAAVIEASNARGYLSLLRRFIALLEEPEYRTRTLQGWIAPELPAAEFRAIVERAEAAETRCRQKV
ncbi:hypothetical protein MK489_15475 [Myxococcota bacterium]|nr:hypothetical protein [Myxococcota bacterium]